MRLQWVLGAVAVSRDRGGGSDPAKRIPLPSLQDPLAPYFPSIFAFSHRRCAPQYPSRTFPWHSFLFPTTRALLDQKEVLQSVKGRKNKFTWRVGCSVLCLPRRLEWGSRAPLLLLLLLHFLPQQFPSKLTWILLSLPKEKLFYAQLLLWS